MEGRKWREQNREDRVGRERNGEEKYRVMWGERKMGKEA